MPHIPRIIFAVAAAALLAGSGVIGVLHVNAAPQGAGMVHSSRAPSLPGFQIGVWHPLAEHGWRGYYDGHQDTYVNNDVSVKSQARTLGINFAPILAHSVSASSPMYFVKGRAAQGQLAVFGSEPGERTYSPLWLEIWVTWKPGVMPILLVKDDQIDELAKAGKLTTRITRIVLNAPITSVGR